MVKIVLKKKKGINIPFLFIQYFQFNEKVLSEPKKFKQN